MDWLSISIYGIVILYFLIQLWKLFGEDIETIYNAISGLNLKIPTKDKKKKNKKSAKDTIRDSFNEDN